mmetsp:Transcript_81481/g.211813  ORF Transcript_81481/g.211813 Transcript_81481/m.211813 type:complete len:257 (-) Transcript_81481:93-863(-)
MVRSHQRRRLGCGRRRGRGNHYHDFALAHCSPSSHRTRACSRACLCGHRGSISCICGAATEKCQWWPQPFSFEPNLGSGKRQWCSLRAAADGEPEHVVHLLCGLPSALGGLAGVALQAHPCCPLRRCCRPSVFWLALGGAAKVSAGPPCVIQQWLHSRRPKCTSGQWGAGRLPLQRQQPILLGFFSRPLTFTVRSFDLIVVHSYPSRACCSCSRRCSGCCSIGGCGPCTGAAERKHMAGVQGEALRAPDDMAGWRF